MSSPLRIIVNNRKLGPPPGESLSIGVADIFPFRESLESWNKQPSFQVILALFVKNTEWTILVIMLILLEHEVSLPINEAPEDAISLPMFFEACPELIDCLPDLCVLLPVYLVEDMPHGAQEYDGASPLHP